MQQCRSGMIGTVSKKLQKKLDPHAPPRSLVENYLIEIAKEKLYIVNIRDRRTKPDRSWRSVDIRENNEAQNRITMLILNRIEQLFYQMNFPLKFVWLT